MIRCANPPRAWLRLSFLLWVACGAPLLTRAATPSVIFILADDLGYGELGCYGQKLIATPRLDRMAAEGMRFTQFYAGSTVCAPSRSVLMTGRHLGHTTVRGNAGARNYAAQALRADDVTLAATLRRGGLATALIGKWGLGEVGSTGDPNRQGFDLMFGYLNQTHAHNHYPSFLWRNGRQVPLSNDLVSVPGPEGVGYSTRRLENAGDLFVREAREFITRSKDRPFFLFLSLVTPHANNERARALGDGNETPDQGPYASKPWSDSNRNHAAMVTRLDRDVGQVLDHLKSVGIEDDTLVLFSSDNGPHSEGGREYDPAFFSVSGPLTGKKRDLTEGGIRVPFLARWPGRVPAGAVSGHVGYFGDMMATLCELTAAPLPAQLDSISFAPTLLARGEQKKHDFLYWEFYESGPSQAVLMEGRWKAIRSGGPQAAIRFHDLESDLPEQRDVSASNSPLVSRAAEIMRQSHVPNEHWSVERAMAAKAK